MEVRSYSASVCDGWCEEAEVKEAFRFLSLTKGSVGQKEGKK